MAWTKEQAREYARAWRKNNPERVREHERRRYAKHRDKRREESRLYYGQRKDERLTWMNETKEFLGCFICGDEQPHRLSWHHLVPLRDNDPSTRVSSIVTHKGVQAATEAMKRCVLLCANCHADVHHSLLWPDTVF